ncbi:carboxylesterase family protein [Phytohalomonas tamaricis]|uniref:carboxylesterase family protein n=1 Tax=Phytohalomonas tamaricis TaxID=2081032 RepID=UPI000D0B3A1D|nr:hypothetical protein [Phytohalomonas tamaricis]
MIPDDNIQLIEASPLRYLLSVPAAPAPEAGWPLLCFLHGYDEAAPLDIRDALTRHGPLWPGRSSLAREEFIVIAPQLPSAGDVWHRFADDVLNLVIQVRSQHGGDPHSCYLSGFSFGGNGVFDLGIAQTDHWAALWAVDPTRVPRQDPQRPVWLSVGEAARYRQQGFVRALGLKPVKDNELGDRLYLDQGESHVGSARRAYADERIYRWLLAQRLSNPS